MIILRHRLPHSLKQGVRTAFRNLTGLDVRFASNYNVEEMTYRGNDWGLRRTLHFERLLQKVENVDGVIVECGVGAGNSMFNWSLLTKTVARPRMVWGFDTFEGIPPPTAEDGPHNVRMTGAWNYSQRRVKELLRFNGLTQKDLSTILFVQGQFCDTLPNYTGGPIALLHLDVDFYQSYMDALTYLWPHVACGGIVAFDEYDHASWPGATQAVDEFFAQKPEEVIASDVSQYYYVVKQAAGIASAQENPRE